MARIESEVARGTFNCCKVCKPPKRHPACHGSCPEYLAAKGKHDKQKHDEKVQTEADRWM